MSVIHRPGTIYLEVPRAHFQRLMPARQVASLAQVLMKVTWLVKEKVLS